MKSKKKRLGKYTPAPWKTDEIHFVGTDEEDSQTIAYVSDHRNRKRRTETENKANAKLIATAPELLEAANDFVCRLEDSSLDDIEETLWRPDGDGWEELTRLKAAIQKALMY
ncbi:hypothetical protein [Allocoleopsis sp.]|uniref:hypothetical protein n=1 Tax=Allocoleopsis sp. TaxID=3088169 RepID=UPI002FD1E776